MLTYDLSQRGNTPIYQYLYQCIRQDILDGTIRPDEKLPSKRTLAQHLNIGIITVENAYQLLKVEGYIYSLEKIGYFAQRLRQKPASAPVSPRPIPKQVREELFADFSSNKVDDSLFPVSVMAKLCREMISLKSPDFLKTVPYNGTPVLRYALADYLARYRGMQVDPEQIIIGCGTEYLYSRLLECFPDHAVLGLEDPGNHKFAKIAGKYRIPVSCIPTDDAGILPEDLKKSNVTVLHISPANMFPLGSIMPIQRRLDILSWLYEEENRYLIEDDFDSEFNAYGYSDSSLFSNDFREHTIYLNTFSKTMIPSLRAAYMVLPRTLMRRYRETASFYSCTVSSSDQFIFSNFIGRGYFERHLQHTNNVFRSKKRALLREIEASGLENLGNIKIPPAGTSVILENLQSANSAEEIKRNARQLGIGLAFVSDYMEHPSEKERRMLILNYASVPDDRFPDALQRVYTSVRMSFDDLF